MVYKTPRFIKVGKRAKDDSKQIRLLGMTLEPNHYRGNILFLQGFSGNFEDYMQHFLEPLAETFRVDVYNYRGHPGSEGKFNHKLGIGDVETILNKTDDTTFVLAQSYGANLATQLESDKVPRVYCVTPLFDLQMLPFLHRTGTHLLSAARLIPGLLQIPDYILDSTGLSEKAGFPNKYPLQSFAQLAKLKEDTSDKPMAFALADCDEVIGTHNNTARYLRLIDRIKSRFPHAQNRSELVRGLNHCLNLTPGDFIPFLKPEQGKDSDKIIEDIINFYSE